MTDAQVPTRTRRGLDLATAAELGDLLHELSQDPRTRKQIAKALKAAKPDSPHAKAFADIDTEDKFEEFKREQEAKELKAAQDAQLARMNRQRERLLTGGEVGAGPKYAEDDVKKIEALMQQKGIVDYEDGRVLYAATLPPADPRPGRDLPDVHGSTWEFPEWAKFGPNPNQAARDTAHSMITEFMRKR
jgi:hypothetical protein